MRVTATKLRQNIYAILDEVLEKGIPVEVERKGKILKIVPEKKTSIWDRMAARPSIIVGDPEEFKNYKYDWEKDWREPQNLEDVAREYAARKRRARKKRA
jgi:hypothetical protein